MDKQNIDKLTEMFFNSFTNKNGMKPNVRGLHQLFIPNGIIIKTCGVKPEIYNLEQFIEPREKLLNDGLLIDFKEEEVSETTEIFGNIAHRFSLYQKSGLLSGVSFETKGMKTIQFIKKEDGWKISAVAWDDEREGLQIPEKYLAIHER
ncbi:hypothetical protein [Paenibacillus alba]|uniref:Nuclear transport factor 2 family protein n=1 Tax=Paenibacillus alba TaxID=1197127 RepID=A0ABU6FZY3_9BACL|nr:hypothetical protein [Paenibacillus alba]MEC0227281.1 hypothetical protein [Paenibacillus alba]